MNDQFSAPEGEPGEWLTLESELARALEETHLSEHAALPPLHVFQQVRRQRARLRPQAAIKPKDTYHHGNLRESLIAITMQQAEAKGLGELSLRAIAKEAGVSAPALYRHFKDKEALLAAAAEQGFQELVAWLEFTAPAALPVQQRLKRFCQAYLRFMLSYPLYFQLMFGGEIRARQSYPPLISAQEEMLAPLIQIILSGRQQGLFRDDIATETQVLHCWSSLHGLTGLLVLNVLDAGDEHTQQSLLRDLLQQLFLSLQPTS